MKHKVVFHNTLNKFPILHPVHSFIQPSDATMQVQIVIFPIPYRLDSQRSPDLANGLMPRETLFAKISTTS